MLVAGGGALQFQFQLPSAAQVLIDTWCWGSWCLEVISSAPSLLERRDSAVRDWTHAGLEALIRRLNLSPVPRNKPKGNRAAKEKTHVEASLPPLYGFRPQ